jgi:hypothetical protein
LRESAGSRRSTGGKTKAAASTVGRELRPPENYLPNPGHQERLFDMSDNTNQQSGDKSQGQQQGQSDKTVQPNAPEHKDGGEGNKGGQQEQKHDDAPAKQDGDKSSSPS